MSAQTYAAKARKHWTKWLPKKVQDLKDSGQLEATLQAVGKATQHQVLELMQQGYRQHEAEEVALAQHVLLPPEPDAATEPWEREELASLEREYRQKMRG